MKKYRRMLLILVLIVSSHSVINAATPQWYWISIPDDPQKGYFIEEEIANTVGYTGGDLISSGNKTVVPYDFMKVMDDTKDSIKCSGQLNSGISQLRSFDTSKVVKLTSKCFGDCSYFTRETVKERESLLSNIKYSAEQCLLKEEKEIQAAKEEVERKKAEEQRLKDVTNAVQNCDFDYFENEMTNAERMKTYDDRLACEKVTIEPKLTNNPPEVSNANSVTQPTNSIVPIQISTPRSSPIEVISQINTSNQNGRELEDVPATHSEQQVTNDSVIPQPEIPTEPEKPSLLRRVANFLFGWFR